MSAQPLHDGLDRRMRTVQLLALGGLAVLGLLTGLGELGGYLQLLTADALGHPLPSMLIEPINEWAGVVLLALAAWAAVLAGLLVRGLAAETQPEA